VAGGGGGSARKWRRSKAAIAPAAKGKRGWPALYIAQRIAAAMSVSTGVNIAMSSKWRKWRRRNIAERSGCGVNIGLILASAVNRRRLMA